MEPLIGNAQAKQILTRFLDRIPHGGSHTLLFSGPRGVGKGLFARAFAREILKGNEIDLHLFVPSGKAALHSIDSMRSLTQRLSLPPTSATYKVFVIDEAERLPSISAHALLKTFEEPPDNTFLLLISSAPDQLLPTVRSRCRELRFIPVEEREISQFLRIQYNLDELRADRLAHQSGGSVAVAVKLAQGDQDLLVMRLLELLSRLHSGSYVDISLGIEEIMQVLEKEKQKAHKEAILACSGEGLSCADREQWEKEAEGAASVLFFQEIERLLETVASWYRDLFLIQVIGERERLSFPQWLPVTSTIPSVSLEKVEASIRRCYASISRFSKPSHCFEALLLELHSGLNGPMRPETKEGVQVSPNAFELQLV